MDQGLRGPSRTALMASIGRALHREGPPPPVDVLDERGRALLADISSTAAKLGEPFVSLLRREEVEQLLTMHGMVDLTHFGAPDAARDYFPGSDITMPDVQRLATAVVSAGSFRVRPSRRPPTVDLHGTRPDHRRRPGRSRRGADPGRRRPRRGPT